MLPRILAIYSVSLIIFKSSESAPAVAKSRQFLPAISGFIPVYIREGDTPLEDINLELAEAFNGYSGRPAFSRLSDKFDGKEKIDNTKSYGNAKENGKDISVDSNIIVEIRNDDETAPKLDSSRYLHIQKISRP